MKVLVTGCNGQLGYDVIKRLAKLEIEYIGTDISEFDLTDVQETKAYIIKNKPDVVIHCAAYTAVDKAEDEKELCYKINVLGTRYIAEACAELEAKMVYISTDYVFDGAGEKPFEVTDKPSPINYYGQTKYEGELEVQKTLEKYFIIRTSWVFGSNGNNFVKTMLRLGREKREISVVDDQIGSPTYTYDLAMLIAEMITTYKYGIYHAANKGYCSWYEFAQEIFKQASMSVKVKPIKTEDYPTKAKRPKNSRLDKSNLDRAGFERIEEWKEALTKFLSEAGEKNGNKEYL